MWRPWRKKRALFRVTLELYLPLRTDDMADAALDAAINTLATAVTNAANRIATAIQPVDLTSEIAQINDITKQVDALVPAAPVP